MSENENEKKSLFDRLTPEQRARLQNLSADISFDRITVSFSLDEKDMNGRKRSAFYSLGCSRKATDETDSPVGFNQEEIRLVRCVISKQVVATVYDDAVKRGMLNGSSAKDELRPILEAYDNQIARLLAGEVSQ